MDNKRLNVVVLAAGKGTRMYSRTPKVLHRLAGKSLLQHTLDTAAALGGGAVHVVVGHGGDAIREAFPSREVRFATQSPQLGTAHAVQQTLDALDHEAVALVLYADVPLVTPDTLRPLIEAVDAGSMAVLTCEMDNPAGLGRILRDERGEVAAIVEEKDADADQRRIREINTGIMAIPVARLHDWLPRIGNDNAQGEYYLTDVVSLARADGCAVHGVACGDVREVTGVNNRAQLAALERYWQRRRAEELMLAGVTLRDPDRLDIRGEVAIATDVTIDVNVVLAGRVSLGENVSIGPNCLLADCDVAAGTVIQANSVIEGASIGAGCSIGPFARIRPGTELHKGAKVGNFVETKQAVIGPGSKVNHLSYVGDSTLGAGVNVGAGTITCNYDGAAKHHTIIGDDVFIGSNTALVAPVRLASGATIAAGSTITHDVAADELAIARNRQTNKSGWIRPGRKGK